MSNTISLHPYPLMISHESDNSQAQSPTRTATPQASPPQTQVGSNPKAATSTALESERIIDDPALRRTAATLDIDPDQEELERQPRPSYTEENDPLLLSTRLKTNDQITGIRHNISRRNSLVGTLNLTKDAAKARKVGEFYEEQNEKISRLLKPVDEHRREAKELNESNALRYKVAVHASFAANVCLAILQLYGAISSKSLSLFTTMADALFDPLSNLQLILCHRAIKNVNPRKFPQGKARIETAGNISFCFLMCAVSLVLLVLSAREIAEGSSTRTSDFHLPSIIAVSTAFGVKFALFLYCYPIKDLYSQVEILWEDHRNDLIINGAGICTSVLGSKVQWWIDPAGAIFLAILIMTLWVKTAVSEFQLLIGVTADTSILQHITYISMTHSPVIKALDTVRAWHSGPRLIVEVDIVMEAGDSLQKTHDIAEELQTKIESLPNVDRAYVHVDYETNHAPEHFWKKEL